MSAVRRDALDALTNLPERAQLDSILAEDQWRSERALANALGDPTAFAHLSDLDVACAYQSGDAALEDALYCELHRRGLSPWALVPDPARNVTP